MLNTALTDSWLFFTKHFVAMSVIILPIFIPANLFVILYQHFFTSEQFVFFEHIIPISIGIFVFTICSIAVVFYIVSTAPGRERDVTTLWKLGLKYSLPYVVLMILVGSAVFAVFSGSLLLVVPGIIITIKLSFSIFDLLLNQTQPINAIKNSWRLTTGYAWTIFLGILIITTPLYFLDPVFNAAVVHSQVVMIIYNAIYSVLTTLYVIFTYRMYEFAKSQQHQDALSEDAPISG